MGRDIAGRIDIRIGAAKGCVDSDPAVGELETGRVSEGDVRCGADADQYRVCRYGMPTLDQNRRSRPFASETFDAGTQPEVHAMITMERGECGADLLTDYTE